MTIIFLLREMSRSWVQRSRASARTLRSRSRLSWDSIRSTFSMIRQIPWFRDALSINSMIRKSLSSLSWTLELIVEGFLASPSFAPNSIKRSSNWECDWPERAWNLPDRLYSMARSLSSAVVLAIS